MNKYNWQFKKHEKIYASLNDFKLSVILFNLKSQMKHLVNNKEDVDNHFVIIYMLLEYCNFLDKSKPDISLIFVHYLNLNKIQLYYRKA